VPEIEEFNGSYLVNVRRWDGQFKFANISFQSGNMSGVFRREYSPEGASGRQYAYYITNEGYGPQDESSTWYSNIVKVGRLCSTHCSVSSNDCQVLVTALKQAREQREQTKKKRQDKEKQDGDMNGIQSTVSKQASSSIVSPPVVFKHAVAELRTEPTEHPPTRLINAVPGYASSTGVASLFPDTNIISATATLGPHVTAYSLDKAIVDGLRDFLNTNSIKGTVSNEVRFFAVQAVMAAACHNPTLVTEYSVEQVAQRLGTRRQNVSKALEQEKDSMFKASPRKKRKDCVFEDAQLCVLRYCHSDQGPRVDTESNECTKSRI